MSLADQQWCPTSVQVTVLQARGLRIKGKGGTNDAYAIMQVAKEKYQTSVAEKSVAPVWKEEASFDLPQLLQPGTERTTLRVHVLHRALVGPDKLLGQAVINLKELSENRTRNKSEWFKLLDKTGKADKDRGEVLVDIQFLRNNMTASMFDLSAAGKSRSRLGKFKDKVRGKKKELDTMSNVMPSFSQVLTDSEEEGNENAEVAAGKGEKKKKKIKSLFSPKSNLQRNMSQSMSVLPAKNSSMSGSQSSGLNMDFSEGKKKFKFKIHKRSDSRDSSSGVTAEQSNLCINGSHVYCEEPPPRTSRVGSNFSLASSGHGSMEDVPESSPPSVESLQAVRQYSPWTEEEEEETAEVEKGDVGELKREEEERMRRRKKEEEEKARKQEEAERLAEEERRREERMEELERWRIEEEKKQREEEERIRMEEEKAEEERRRQEEERRFAEEKRRLEEERRIEEEKIRKAEEERMEREERERKEEEERARREEEEQERLAEEKRRMAEEERRIQEEEERQREEEERIRMEEERAEEERRRQEEEEARKQEADRKLAEEKKRMEEEERRIREEEERQREEEERIRMEEERRRQEEEKEEARKQEVERKLAEEKKRMKEEERRIQEEEERQREEEERIRMEEQRAKEERRRKEREEKARKEEEERELAEEKRRLEEEEKAKREEERCREEEEKLRRQEELEEKRRVEEQERRQREEEERIKREEEEERARKEREEYERLQEEKRKLEEEEQKRLNEEKKKKEEEEEEEKRFKLEQERKRKEEEEKRQREEKEKHELLMAEEKTRQLQEETRAEQEKHGEAASTNPFDETFSNNPFEESHNSLSGPNEKVQQRSQSSGSLLGSKPASTDEKDVITAQREKRPAPQPPGERRSESEQDRPAQHLVQMNKPNKDKDVRTVSVPPQRSVQMIAPMSRSVTDVNTQSLTQSGTSKEATNIFKPGKRPAPTRPSSGAKTGSETKQERVVYGLNPFEDDEEETELTVQSDAPTTSSAQWPVAVSQAADKDAASQAKLKSSKKARAPLLPANTSSTSINQNTEGNSVPDKNGTAPDSSVTQHCDLKHTPESPGERSEPAVVQTAKEEAHGKKEAPPTPSRRLLPVKPLNSLRQQSVSATQEEKEHRSAVLVCEHQEKTKVDETAPKGPFSQLSRQELISLVLKQETLLSQRDVKITELEQYIDNLLVRVIEEQPSILMSLKSKPV